MNYIDNEKLPVEVRWEIARLLKRDRLDKANNVQKVINPPKSFYAKYGKRVLDILISSIALVCTLPINVIVGIICYFDVGSPLLFKQERAGKDKRIFRIIKFRSMTTQFDSNGRLLPPDERVTKWGKIIRKTSIDELLNFWSVLKGDMSIIGPRPLPPQYLERYSNRHNCRHYVRPGLECPPHKREMSRNDWHDQFENDIWYVENISFLVDIKLLIALFGMVFDNNSSSKRATGLIGDFIGYSSDGIHAISVYDVDEIYINMAIDNCGYKIEDLSKC